MTSGLPDEDLSDLGNPGRGEGYADFFDATSDELEASSEDTVEQRRATTEDEAPPPVPTPRGRRRARSSERRAPGTATVYVSPRVRDRFEDYRVKNRYTNRDVILQAIAACHDRLPDIIEKSKVSTAPVSELFPADPRAVKYLGGGGVQVQFTPTREQAAVIDQLGERMGFNSRSTWIAPVLNEWLPGRKEKLPERKEEA